MITVIQIPQERRRGVDLKPYSVAIGRGDGLIARTGDVVMYIADATGAAPLLGALESAAEAPSPGRALAKALGAIALGPDSRLIPPFGVLAPAGDGLLLMLRGHVAADILAGGVSRTLVGDRALTWVDETVREPVDRIVIGDVSGLTAVAHTNLVAGVVPGGGFVVSTGAAARPAMPAPAVAEAVAPAVAEESQPETRAAKPVERQRFAAPAAPAAPTQRRPPPGQPDDAQTRKAAPPTAMARPVIGALAADDEAVYPLDRPYVIGRNPLIDRSVRDAQASPIFLPDDPQISRVHAYVTVDAGVVLVRDAGTPGGTYVAAPGDESWIRVGDRPTELKPGWCMRIGQQILVYQKASSAQ
jgi:hypothetical protein